MQRWVRAKAPLGYLLDRRPFRLLHLAMQLLYSPMHSNPLEVQYYSNVPFLLGEGQAVQYSLAPVRAGRSRIPVRPAENYLRDAMVRTLTEGDWEMDFMVQVQTDPHLMPIENATVHWPEQLSPYVPVARLTDCRPSGSTPTPSSRSPTCCASTPGTAFPSTGRWGTRTGRVARCTSSWRSCASR